MLNLSASIPHFSLVSPSKANDDLNPQFLYSSSEILLETEESLVSPGAQEERSSRSFGLPKLHRFSFPFSLFRWTSSSEESGCGPAAVSAARLLAQDISSCPLAGQVLGAFSAAEQPRVPSPGGFPEAAHGVPTPLQPLSRCCGCRLCPWGITVGQGWSCQLHSIRGTAAVFYPIISVSL